MASKQLRNRVDGPDDSEIQQGSVAEGQMQGAQTETLENLTDDSMLGAAGTDQSAEVVNTVGKEVRLGSQPPTERAESQATVSQDTLGEFLANAFGRLQDDIAKLSEKLQSDNAKLSKKLSENIQKVDGSIRKEDLELKKELRDNIRQENEKLIERF
jgi:hypothetical protein